MTHSTYSEKVYVNGSVLTLCDEQPMVEAFAVKDGRFVFVGSNEGSKPFIGPETKVIELRKRRVLPSFIDAHAHANLMVKNMNSVNLMDLKTEEDYINAVRSYLDKNRDKEFIIGQGWENTHFPVSGPKKEILDTISSDIPIALWSNDYHSIWANTKCLELAGIKKGSKITQNEYIEKNEDGSPAGTVREQAMDYIQNSLPDFSVEQYKDAILEYQNIAHSLGYTGVFDPLLYPDSNAVQAYNELSAEELLTLRFRGAYLVKAEDVTAKLDYIIDKILNDKRNEYFSVISIKILYDGVIEGATAYLLEEYAPGAKKPEGYRGYSLFNDNELSEIFQKSTEAKIPVHCHSIGDASTKKILDIFSLMKSKNANPSLRNAITHLQLVDEKDISRFHEMNIIAVINPYWAVKDDYYYNLQLPYLGRERAEKEYPVKSFFKKGVLVASASDFPVTNPPNPFIGIETALTRTIPHALKPIICADPDNEKHNVPLWKEEQADRCEMIKSFTYNGAYANFLETITGTIEVGKSADFIILNRDILDTPATDIGTIEVMATYFKGRKVFKRG